MREPTQKPSKYLPAEASASNFVYAFWTVSVSFKL